MESVNLFIKENVGSIGKGVYVTPEIPEKKLNNAIKAFECEKFHESILAIYDNTLFGSGKEGLVFTGEKMLYHNGDLIEFVYKNIQSVEYKKNIMVENNGKETVEHYILIAMDDKEFKIEQLGKFNYSAFSNMLNLILSEFDEYKEENQLKTISEMPNELKTSYLKIIINMTFMDDEGVDEKELAELFLLMARLELDEDARFNVRSYLTELNNENILSIESLLEKIKEKSEASHYQALMISLAKDLINVYYSTKNTTNRDFKFLEDHQKLFKLSNEEIDLAYDTVENDYKLLNEDMDDNAIKKGAKELAAKAAAAGVPLAAVYLSGSVIGMSAAGITSGLATLGLGMGMTGGIAVVAIIGVLSYKGIKQLTGANELDKYKTRDLMLHEVIKQTQKTISLTISDINHLIKKLNEILLNHAEQREKVARLVKMVAQFQGALKNVDSKSNIYQNSVSRLKNPKILDEERLKELTSEPTKKPLYDFVIVNYEQKVIEIGNKNEEVEKLVLKEGVATEILDKMSEIFGALGYFDMDNILKSKASGMIKGLLG